MAGSLPFRPGRAQTRVVPEEPCLGPAARYPVPPPSPGLNPGPRKRLACQ